VSTTEYTGDLWIRVDGDWQLAGLMRGGPPGPPGPSGQPVTTYLDPWHYIGRVGEPGFQNGWVNYGAPYGGAAFRKFPDGKVKLKGLICNGAAGVIFTLPPGYRPPSQTLIFAAKANAGTCDFRVDANGNVSLSANDGSASAAAWMSFSDTEFDTETVMQWLTGPRGPSGGGGGSGPDIADVKMTASATEPPGWVFCRGQAISRVSYAALWAVIGSIFGGGDGASTFNVPDMRDRFPIGSWSNAHGSMGGETNHTLTNAEMPYHSHGGVSATENQGFNFNFSTGGRSDGAQYQPMGGQVVGNQANSVYAIPGYTSVAAFAGPYDHSHSGTTGTQNQNHNHNIPADGGNATHNNTPQFTALNYVIYTGVTS